MTPKYTHTQSLFCKRKYEIKHFLDILEKRIFSKKAYVRSDNAGCFHGFASIYAMPFLSSEIKCAHMDFADPQGGKCICDKKVSQVCHQTACK